VRPVYYRRDARFGTKPCATGSDTCKKTMGMAWVARNTAIKFAAADVTTKSGVIAKSPV